MGLLKRAFVQFAGIDELSKKTMVVLGEGARVKAHINGYHDHWTYCVAKSEMATHCKMQSFYSDITSDQVIDLFYKQFGDRPHILKRALSRFDALQQTEVRELFSRYPQFVLSNLPQ